MAVPTPVRLLHPVGRHHAHVRAQRDMASSLALKCRHCCVRLSQGRVREHAAASQRTCERHIIEPISDVMPSYCCLAITFCSFLLSP